MKERRRSICYFVVPLWGWAILYQGSVLLANPVNPTVVAGNASFSTPSATALEVTADDRCIISWEEFSISSQESTRFILPDTSSVVLNRVTSGLISHLDGLLTSNATVYLINPNGVLVGPSGVINTAGFLASTLDVDNQQFINAGDLLFSGSSLASIVNQGTITCWDGDTILLAYQVENTQTLQASQGVVAIGCAEQILLTPAGDQRITVQIPTIRPKDPSASFGVHQLGIIQAIQAELKADGNPYTYAIKNEGWVNATGVDIREGRIFLIAPDGLTSSSGILSAANSGDSGGEIQVLGQIVTLTDKAEVYTSSYANGGTILIGGDFQGSNPDVLNALITFVDSGVLISANSLQSGDGGRVIAWADGINTFYGTVRAQGGSLSGNGGFAEISGVDNLDFQGSVDLTAPRGVTGMLLLDPSNVTISTGADANITVAACPAGNYTTTANTAVINIATLLTNLATCSISIVTTPGGAQAGTITLANPLNWTGTNANTLTVTSLSTMTFNAALTNNTTAGTMIWNSGAATAINAAITNGPTGAPVITLNSVGTITQAVGGPIVNSSATGTIYLTTTAATSDITLNGALTNSSTSGVINLTSGRDILPNVTITNSSTSGTVIGNANRNITFGAGAGFTSSSSGTSTFIADITTAGTLSTTATSTIAISGTGGLTLQGNNANGSNAINLLGPINHNSSGLLRAISTTTGNISTGTVAAITATSGPLTFDTTPTGGTITIAGTVTFTNTATGAFTVHAQNAGAVATGLALNNTIDYSSSGAFNLTLENGNILTSAANTLMLFRSGAGNVTISSVLGNFTTNAATAVTFNSGAGNLSITTPGAGGSITLGATTTFNSGAGKSATLTANTTTALNNFTYNATGACNITGTAGNVTLAAATTFDVGALTASGAVTLTAGASITGGATSTFNFHNLATSLTMNAATSITLVNLLYSAPGNCVLTATNGTITTSGNVTFPNGVFNTGGLTMQAGLSIATNGALTFNTGAGVATATGLTMTATNGNITIGAAGSINYTSVEPAQMTANNGAITETGSITFNSGSGNLTLTTLGVATGNIALNGPTTFNAGAGGLTVNANVNFSNAGTITYNSSNPFSITSAIGNITTNGAINLATSATLNMTSTTGVITINNQTRNTGTGPINATCSGTFSVGTGAMIVPAQIGSAGGDVTINITGAGDVQVLGGAALNAFAQIGFDTGNVTSNLIFTRIGANLVLTGGSSNSCYALIGHGSQIGGGSGGTRTGNITFGSAPNPIPGTVALQGRTSPVSSLLGVGSFAQIGHVRALTAPPVTAVGNIDMRFVTGSVLMNGGNRTGAYALIGDGGVASGQADSYTGNIQVHTLANTSNISLFGGSATQAFANIGHTAFVNTPAVNVSITSALTEAIAGLGIVLSSQSNAEAVIGGYVNASAGSGTIAITNLNVQSQNGGGIQATSALLSNSFNGVLIGALAYTGSVPITAAGTAGSNLNVTCSGNLNLSTGNTGTSTNTFALIQNGIGSPAGGPFSTTVTSTGTIDVTGGNNIASINSIGPLTCIADGPLLVTSDPLLGNAEISGMGTTLIQGATISALGSAAGPLALIENTTGNLTVTSSTGSLILLNNGEIALTGGSGTLSVSVPLGPLMIANNSFITNEGSGPTSAIIGSSTLLQGGAQGPSFISGDSSMTVTTGTALVLIADPGGRAAILSQGDTTIQAEALSLYGDEALFPALIQNTTGNLTITATDIFQETFGEINLSGGSGTLSVTATTESIELTKASFIQNQGTGPTTLTTAQNLIINGGVSGPSSVISNTDMTINVGFQLNMTGRSDAFANILASAGNLTINAARMNVKPNSLVSLNGGSGNLSITLSSDLTLAFNSTLQNLGTGNSTYTVGGTAMIFGGLGSGTISGNTGTLMVNVGGNLNLISNSNGSAIITANGPLAITAENVDLSGLGTGQQSIIRTTAGALSVIAQNDIAIRDNATVQNSGPGTLTLVADQQAPTPPLIGPGRFILDPGATVTTTGGGLLRIFTARPNGITSGNLAFGQVNGNFVTAGLSCPFDAPPSSATNQYNTYFSTFGGGFGTPYTIFYKTSGPLPPPPPPPPTPPGPPVPSQFVLQQKLSNVIYASSELFFIVRHYTEYDWNRPYFACCRNLNEEKNVQKTPFDCKSFAPGSYPTSHQNWTKYPVYFSEATGCSDLGNL